MLRVGNLIVTCRKRNGHPIGRTSSRKGGRRSLGKVDPEPTTRKGETQNTRARKRAEAYRVKNQQTHSKKRRIRGFQSSECLDDWRGGAMRTGDPRYAVKFMARVDEEVAEEASARLRGSVAPSLREWGFGEVLTVSRRLQVVESLVLRRLLENAPAESGYAGHIRDLHETLVMGGPKSHAHSMLHHRGKEAYPEEYALIQEALRSEGNWARISVRQFDCYALYDTEVDVRADTLGRGDLAEGRPHSGDLVAGEIGDLLVSPLRGTRHTVLYRPPLPDQAIYLAYTAQTQVSAFLHRKEARAWVQEQLLPALTAQRGYLGALVLRSMNTGFVAGRGTVPRGLGEHRGEDRGPDRKSANDSTVLCECVTLWETEAGLEAGVGRIAGSLPGMPEGELANEFIERFVRTERGELVSWA